MKAESGRAIRLADAEAELAAPPENVLGGLRPLVGDEIFDLALAQAGAEVAPEVGGLGDAGEERVDARAIGAADAVDEDGIEERIAGGHLARPGLEGAAGQIAAGKLRRPGPRATHLRKEGAAAAARRARPDCDAS